MTDGEDDYKKSEAYKKSLSYQLNELGKAVRNLGQVMVAEFKKIRKK